MNTTMKMIAQLMKRGMKSSATTALATLAVALVPASLQAKVIKVPSGTILTIQQAVDTAAPGDTVIVLPGTYGAGPGEGVTIWFDKPGLKLKAAGPVKIVGPGWGPGVGILIYAGDACVEGFDISGFGRGIVAWDRTEGTQTQITGNKIHDCSSVCIELRGASNYEVAHNTLVGGLSGIFLAPMLAANPQHHIHHNRVSGSQGDGIRLDTTAGCSLDNNECYNNDEFGIYLAHSPNCTADHNQADNNGWVGIVVLDSLNCAVAENEANNNASWGIWVDGSWSRFERNVAEGNGQYDLFAPYWGNSDPTCNTYLKNRADTAVPSLALWDVKPSK